MPKPGQPVILVAGGMAVAPLYFLADTLKENVHLIVGARSACLHVCHDDFTELCCDDYCIATDDGTLGHHGFVTDILKQKLAELSDPMVYACGPMPMLSRVAAIVGDTPCEVSLEAKMACGIGACMGCVVPTKSGFLRVCHEGPVFAAQDILWEKS
jgi:dihydroorotate dehydrogenase electron transfer subunit